MDKLVYIVLYQLRKLDTWLHFVLCPDIGMARVGAGINCRQLYHPTFLVFKDKIITFKEFESNVVSRKQYSKQSYGEIVSKVQNSPDCHHVNAKVGNYVTCPGLL